MVDECPRLMVFNEDINKCVYSARAFRAAWAEFIFPDWEEIFQRDGNNELEWGNYIELPGDLPIVGVSEDEYSRIVNNEFDKGPAAREKVYRYKQKSRFDPSNPKRNFDYEAYDPDISGLKDEIPSHIIDKFEERNIKRDGRILKAVILTDGDRYMFLARPKKMGFVERGYIMLHQHQLCKMLPFKGDDFFLKT